MYSGKANRAREHSGPGDARQSDAWRPRCRPSDRKTQAFDVNLTRTRHRPRADYAPSSGVAVCSLVAEIESSASPERNPYSVDMPDRRQVTGLGVGLILVSACISGCGSGGPGSNGSTNATQTVPPPSTTVESAAITSCDAAQLHISLSSPINQDRHTGLAIEFVLESGHSCTLSGYPTVIGVFENGRTTVALESPRGVLGGQSGPQSGPAPLVVVSSSEEASSLMETEAQPTNATPDCSTLKTVQVALKGARPTPLPANLPVCGTLNVHPIVGGWTGGATGFG